MSPPISEDLKTITTTTYDSVILDSLKAIVTLPKTNIAPENGWLEY